MSNVKAATKVGEQILSRLFNHGHFTSGEINFVSRELGDRCGLDGDFNKLIKTNQDVCLVSDMAFHSLPKLSDDLLRSVGSLAGQLSDRAQSILKLEEEYRRKEAEMLLRRRQEREQLLEKRRAELANKLNKVKKSLAEEERDLERKYLKLEQDISASSHK